MWPSLVDMSRDDCRRALRSLELETYGNAVSVLRAQGCLGPEKRKLLQDLAVALNIPIERHKAEVRKAVNDERLNTIAETLFGPNTATEWAIEGRRLVPLIPREPPRTAFSLIADQAANMLVAENSRLGPPSETASKAAECPVIAEPASPEPTKTQIRSQSPPGIVMLPTGTAIQVKREGDEDEKPSKRQRSGSQDLSTSSVGSPMSPPPKLGTPTQVPIASRTVNLPPGSTPLKIALPTSARHLQSNTVTTLNSSKVIIVSSATSPGTSSILQKTLSVPIKSVAGNTPNSKASVIYTQSIPQQITSSTSLTGQTQESGYIVANSKLRTKPIIGSIPKPRPSAIVMSNQIAQSPQGIVIKNQAKPVTPTTSTAPHLKTALQTTKHTVPIQSISGLQLKSQSGERTPATKILVQQKTLPRPTVPKPLQQKGVSTVQHKTIHTGVLPKTTPHSVVVQQKPPGKQNVVTSVQVKTAQGYANVPIQLRTTKQAGAVQIKQDSGGTVKMLALSAGAKILPKPAQPVYMMAASTSGLSIVTRTITSSSSPRVMTVSTPSGAQVRTTQSNIFTTKPMQTVHVMAQPTRRQNVVLVQKGITGKGSTFSPGGKDMLGKMLMTKSTQGGLTTISVQKPQTSIATSTIAQSIQNLPVAQTQSGNVILLDLSNQESVSKNATLAEFLQASGILAEGILDKPKIISSDESIKVLAHGDSQIEEEEEDDGSKTKVESLTDVQGKPEELEAAAVPTLSIEEAVEMLNRSDTPETRALLSQAGIQISDEIGDSEEEEVLDSQIVEVKADVKDSAEEVDKKEDESEYVGQLDANTTTYATPTVSIPMTTTPRTMDIFSTALASANINLDNFMEEEDEPEQVLTEVPATTNEQTLDTSGDVSEPITETTVEETSTTHSGNETL